MLKFIKYIIILTAAVLMSVPLFAQSVSNTDCRQEGKKIVVTYTLDKPSNIELWYSTDGGKNYLGPLKKVSGDVGKNVHSGNNSIVWDVLEEVEGLSGTGIVFKVVPSFALSGYENGYEWVDLGLSVKWASCNLGAKTPEHNGDYYAWGETETKSDYNYTCSNLKYCTDSSRNHCFSKYVPSHKSRYWSGSGIPDNKSVLDPQDDAAHVKLGGSWRMPTDSEWTELRKKCKWTWTGRGYKVNGPSGKSIFLPVARYIDGESRDYARFKGYYWSSSLDTGSPYFAWHVFFDSYGVDRDYSPRYIGQSIRPVSD